VRRRGRHVPRQVLCCETTIRIDFMATETAADRAIRPGGRIARQSRGEEGKLFYVSVAARIPAFAGTTREARRSFALVDAAATTNDFVCAGRGAG